MFISIGWYEDRGHSIARYTCMFRTKATVKSHGVTQVIDAQMYWISCAFDLKFLAIVYSETSSCCQAFSQAPHSITEPCVGL